MLKLANTESARTVKNECSLEDKAAYDDHHYLVERYLQSHRIQNYSSKTIKREKSFLLSWFKEHGSDHRPLYTWEAMKPVVGRKMVQDYAGALLDGEISTNTVRSYLGMLSRYFSYVLEFPYFDNCAQPQRINHRYNDIDQPVSEFDLPTHVYNGEKLGVPFDPEKLYEFYAIVKNNYLNSSRYLAITARNYAMVVLAGESGLRVDEIIHLELVDLFFESHKLQTRYAKATRGSGKRSRVTLFTPLAKDTIKFYLQNHRSKFPRVKESPFVFLSKTGGLIDYTSAHLALKKMIGIANKNNFPIAKHMSYHWLRRIFATRFIERFPNQLSILVTLLGHQTPNTVHCYIRHSEAWMDSKIIKMLEGGDKWPSAGS